MSSPAKEFLIDAVYPEHLSRLRRGAPKAGDHPSSAACRRSARKQQRKGNAGRFRTQPVTFHEIKEVDEDNLVEGEELGPAAVTAGSTSKSESDLKLKFELFYKSITRDSGTPGDGETPSTALTQLPKDGESATLSPVPPGFNPRSRPSL